MCGIAALVAGTTGLDSTLIVGMSHLAKHRGPDDAGYAAFCVNDLRPVVYGDAATDPAAFESDLPYAPRRAAPVAGDVRVLLGHRRLSILDLSTLGHQPMCEAGGRYWITYNGEVYNYRELRDELIELGYRFISGSDTEVILHAYAAWGEECLARFNGMFSFVLIDRQTRRLLAVRDRFGVKPLYYWRAPDGMLAFASEIKQFTGLPGWQARINGVRARDFLCEALYEHTDQTLFEGVRQLRGGHLLHCDLAQRAPEAIVRQWYRLVSVPFAGTEQDAAAGLHTLLSDSVRLRLRADVRVGSCLSGGLDSSSIVGLVNQSLSGAGEHERQHVFSVYYDVPEGDERRYIDAVVEKTGVAAHRVAPSCAQLFDTLKKLTWHQDEPFGSTSVFAQWEVFRLAAENGVRVMLDGQGADEALGGYHTYFGARLAGMLRSGRLGALRHEAGAMHGLYGYSPQWLLRQAMLSVLPSALTALIKRASGPPAWFDAAALGLEDEPAFQLPRNWRRSIQSVSQAQLLTSNLPMLLHWEDRDSMAHSVEARVPFLDYRVVEFLLGLPDDHKIAGGITKLVLREAMADVLPPAVAGRTDKMGFVTPEQRWMKNEAGAFRIALDTAVEVSRGVLRPSALDEFDSMVAGKTPFSYLPWRQISFGAWINEFSVAL